MKRGTYCTDDNGFILFADKAFLSMLRIPKYDRINGKKIGELAYFRFYPRYELKVRAQQEGLLENVPVTLVSNDNKKKSFLEDIRVIRDESGDINYYESTIYPVLEMKQINQQIYNEQTPADKHLVHDIV